MTELVCEDFDRLALLDDGGWTHNNHYHPFLLGLVPAQCDAALEIGCGAGAFSRLLAERSCHVLGLDLAPEMVRIARERSKNFLNVEYQAVDVLQWDFPREKYDCIASIATFHHLPLEVMLQKAKGALKPGGVLLILDLFQSEWPRDLLMDCAALPASVILKLVKTGRLRESKAVRAAWAAHGVHDVYLPLSAIRRVCDQVIPGADVRRHFAVALFHRLEETITAHPVVRLTRLKSQIPLGRVCFHLQNRIFMVRRATWQKAILTATKATDRRFLKWGKHQSSVRIQLIPLTLPRDEGIISLALVRVEC